MTKRLKNNSTRTNRLPIIKVGLNLAVNAYRQAFIKYGKDIPKEVKEDITEMIEAGMREAERLELG